MVDYNIMLIGIDGVVVLVLVVLIFMFIRLPKTGPVKTEAEAVQAPPATAVSIELPEIPESEEKPKEPKGYKKKEDPKPIIEKAAIERLKNSDPTTLSKKDITTLIQSVDITLSAILKRIDLHPEDSDTAEELNEILTSYRKELRRRP